LDLRSKAALVYIALRAIGWIASSFRHLSAKCRSGRGLEAILGSLIGLSGCELSAAYTSNRPVLTDRAEVGNAAFMRYFQVGNSQIVSFQ
jgi:hypothetical protein